MNNLLPFPKNTYSNDELVYLRLHIKFQAFPLRVYHKITRRVIDLILSFDPSMPLDKRICINLWRTEFFEQVKQHGLTSALELKLIFIRLNLTQENWINEIAQNYKWRYSYKWELTDHRDWMSAIDFTLDYEW